MTEQTIKIIHIVEKEYYSSGEETACADECIMDDDALIYNTFRKRRIIEIADDEEFYQGNDEIPLIYRLSQRMELRARRRRRINQQRQRRSTRVGIRRNGDINWEVPPTANELLDFFLNNNNNNNSNNQNNNNM